LSGNRQCVYRSLFGFGGLCLVFVRVLVLPLSLRATRTRSENPKNVKERAKNGEYASDGILTDTGHKSMVIGIDQA